jgi:alpha-tubulin suppressor-like RCC1 family protein
MQATLLNPIRAGAHLLLLLIGLLTSGASQAGSSVTAWGYYCYLNGGPSQFSPVSRPPALTDVVALSGGAGHSVALRADGTVRVWGDGSLRQRRVPSGLSNVIAVAAGGFHNLALRSDGTVTAWGGDDPNDPNGLALGQSSVPATLTNAAAVAAGWTHSLALRGDGTVIAWGASGAGQTKVPPGLSNVVAIASSESSCFALKADGNVVAWGGFSDGPLSSLEGLSNIVAISASSVAHHCLALRADGSVLAWGSSDVFGELNVPAGFTNVADFAGGGLHNLVLRTDGTVIAWGAGTKVDPSTGGEYGQSKVPASVTNVAGIAAGYIHSLALTGEVSPFLLGPFIDRTVLHGTTTWFRAAANGSSPLRYQWSLNGAELLGATNALLELENVQPEHTGTYAVTVTNPFGTTTSPGMRLNLAPLFITDQPQSLVLLSGQTAVFQVTASGTGPFTYQWHFNGTDLAGETNRSLVLTRLQAGNTGTYAVTVSSALGSTQSGEASLSLTEVVAWGSDAEGQTNVPTGVTEIRALDGGRGFSLALKSDGTVVAWGRNTYGETEVPKDLTNAVAIAAGNSHALALTAEGRVMGWGGRGLGSDAEVPSALTQVVAIAAGDMHNLALRQDGQVVAWGSNAFGQTHVPTDLNNVVGIAAGSRFSVALKADGTLRTWGDFGGILPLPGHPTPAPLTNVVAIAARAGSYLALTADGRLEVRGGAGRYGEADVPLDLTNVVALAAGESHFLTVTAEGKVVAWGAGSPIPDPWFRPRFPPSPPHFGQSTVPTNLPPAVAIGAGYSHSLAALGGGSPHLQAPVVDRTLLHGARAFLRASATGAWPLQYQWRFNGEDLPGATNALLDLSEVDFADAGRYSVVIHNPLGQITSPEAAVSVAPLFITGQPQDRSVCLGSALSLSVTVASQEPIRHQWRFNGTDLPGATNRTLMLQDLQVSQSGEYSVEVSNALGFMTRESATVSVGLVAAWGDNAYGQTNLPPGLTNLVAVAAGDYHSLALRSDGTIVAWGHAVSDPSGSAVPPGLTNATAIAAGWGFSLALKTDGTVVGWGSNIIGQTNVPAGLSNVISIAAGSAHGLALKADGTVAAWGSRDSGQTRVPAGLSNVVAIAAGQIHSLALTEDGLVKGWGGDSGWGSGRVPTGLSNVVAIATGWQHNVALKTDGTVTAWGAGYAGQTDVPAGLTNVVAIWAAGHHSLARKADGSLVAWGEVPRGNPFLVASRATNLVTLAAGAAHDLALLSSPPLLTALQASESAQSLFLQTGLRSQEVRVTNPNGHPFPAVRVVVSNLSSGSVVYNASGTNAQGLAYVQYSQPLTPGASLDLTIEYFVPNRSAPSASLIVEAVDPIPVLDYSGTPQENLRSRTLVGGIHLIDVRTLAGRTYYVQYSSDLESWRSAFPPATGTGSTVQWVDNGPPKTDSHPRTQTRRFYRVLLAP